MITSFNPENKIQFELYSHLFAQVYKELKEKKPESLTEAEIAAGRFTSLDDYFAHAGDILELNVPRYIMLPLDESAEGIFTINANDRTISIPAQFAKCGAVQTDEMCEMVIFTIDRYFDFQDLGNDNVKICVQWKNANNEEGITNIILKDYETYPGKLRFGWPLTSDITKTAGQVQFAVRFYKKSETPTGDKRYDYLLNTLPNTITVKPTLTIEDPNITVENDLSLFKNFISNSQNPSYPTPKTPMFGNGGQDLIAEGQTKPGYGAINLTTDSLTMTAQAAASDLGAISYRWMYMPAGTENIIVIDETDGTYTINNQDWVLVHSTAELGPKLTERNSSQKYYTLTFDEDDIPVAYELYLDEINPELNKDLYILKTSLTINPKTGKDIVGKYWVEATNTVSINKVSNISSKCTIPAPAAIEIVENKDLPNHIFTDKETETIALGVEIVKDNTNPTYFYKWSKSNVNTDDYEDLVEIEGAYNSTYTVTEPGWYSLHIDSKLNRKVESINSNICKVTHYPEAPKDAKYYWAYTSDINNIQDIKDFINGIYTGDKLEWVECKDDKQPDLNASQGTIILMKIETNLNDSAITELESEELHYAWKVQDLDKGQDWRILTEADQDSYNDNALLVDDEDFVLDSNILVARLPGNRTEETAYNYACEITNIIAGEKAVLDTTNDYTFTFI